MGFFDSLNRKMEASRQRAIAERQPSTSMGKTDPKHETDPSAAVRDAMDVLKSAGVQPPSTPGTHQVVVDELGAVLEKERAYMGRQVFGGARAERAWGPIYVDAVLLEGAELLEDAELRPWSITVLRPESKIQFIQQIEGAPRDEECLDLPTLSDAERLIFSLITSGPPGTRMNQTGVDYVLGYLRRAGFKT